MWKYFKLVRILNLCFILLIQWMMVQFVLSPILLLNDIQNTDSIVYFILLIISMVLIAAGGYVLNDYFDIKIDAINKPEKQLVGVSISRGNAMRFYQLLTFCGIVTSVLLSWLLSNYTLAFILVAITGMLWFYSASYKRQLIIGNIIVAVIAGLTVLIVGITQMAVLQKQFGPLIFETTIPKQIYAWTGGFALFSFLLTWIREIIKDIEDIGGDRELECRTMPIVWGIRASKWVAGSFILMTVALLLILNSSVIPLHDSLSLRYIIFGLILPLVVLAYLIYNAQLPVDYHQASTLTKVIMLMGILYTIVINYLLAKEAGINLWNNFIL